VLRLAPEGLSNQEIAARLYLSLRTIKFHTSNPYGKRGVKSRTEVVAKAHALGLLAS
jgi:LuxR family maltose regulon positive regulatory protein